MKRYGGIIVMLRNVFRRVISWAKTPIDARSMFWTLISPRTPERQRK